MKVLNFDRSSRTALAFLSLVNLGLLLVQGYYVLFLLDKGLSFLDISLIYIASYITTVVVDFPTSNLADKYGRMKCARFGVVALALGFFIYGVSSSLVFFLIGEVIFGIGNAFMSGTFEAWYIDDIKDRGREEEATPFFSVLYAVLSIVGILAGVIAAFLVVFGLSVPFFAAAVISIVAVVLTLGSFKENFGNRDLKYLEVMRSSFQYFRTNSPFRFYVIARILGNTSLIVFYFLYQPYLVSQGLNVPSLGLFFAFLMIATAVGSLAVPTLFKKTNGKDIVTYALPFFIPCFIILMISNTLWLSILVLGIVGFVNGLTMANLVLWRNDLVPSELRASCISLLFTLSTVGMIFTYLVVGLIADAGQYWLAFLVGAVLAAISIPFYFMSRKAQTVTIA